MTIPTWTFWVGVVLIVSTYVIPLLIMIFYFTRPNASKEIVTSWTWVLVLVIAPIVLCIFVMTDARNNWLVNQVQRVGYANDYGALYLETTQYQHIMVTTERCTVLTNNDTVKLEALKSIKDAYITPNGVVVSSNHNLARLNGTYNAETLNGDVIGALRVDGGLLVVTSSGVIYSLGDTPEFPSLCSVGLYAALGLGSDQELHRRKLDRQIPILDASRYAKLRRPVGDHAGQNV